MQASTCNWRKQRFHAITNSKTPGNQTILYINDRLMRYEF